MKKGKGAAKTEPAKVTPPPKAWLDKQRICRGDSELEGYEERILTAIHQKGFKSFQEFLTAHTTHPKTGEAWSLTEHAAELDVPRTPYIRYHTKWVEKNAPRGAIR